MDARIILCLDLDGRLLDLAEFAVSTPYPNTYTLPPASAAPLTPPPRGASGGARR